MRFGKGGNGEGGDFEKPPIGWTTAVLAAVYDLGVRQSPGSTYGPKHQVCLWWELARRNSKGEQFGFRDVYQSGGKENIPGSRRSLYPAQGSREGKIGGRQGDQCISQLHKPPSSVSSLPRAMFTGERNDRRMDPRKQT